jgi:hypothetical protein
MHALPGLGQDRERLDVLRVDFSGSGQLLELFSHKIKFLADSKAKKIIGA